MTNLDLLCSLYNESDELLIDVLVDEHTGWACADFALVKSIHHCTFEGFVQEFIILK